MSNQETKIKANEIFGDYELQYFGDLYQLTSSPDSKGMLNFQDYVHVPSHYKQVQLEMLASCPGLTTDAIDIACSGLQSVGVIEAPNALVLDLPNLETYTKIDAPKAQISMPNAHQTEPNALTMGGIAPSFVRNLDSLNLGTQSPNNDEIQSNNGPVPTPSV